MCGTGIIVDCETLQFLKYCQLLYCTLVSQKNWTLVYLCLTLANTVRF